MFDWLTHEVSQSAITYPVIALACAIDVLIPLVPSETIVITASVLAAQEELFYVSMLGYLGGETFKDSLWLPLATSFAAAMAVGAGFEVWRRLQSRRGKDILGDELPEEMAT